MIAVTMRQHRRAADWHKPSAMTSRNGGQPK